MESLIHFAIGFAIALIIFTIIVIHDIYSWNRKSEWMDLIAILFIATLGGVVGAGTHDIGKCFPVDSEPVVIERFDLESHSDTNELQKSK